MALPLSGQISLGDIRTELGMSGTSDFSLINASTSAGGYPPLNIYSYFKPNQLSPYSIGEWYGYDHNIGYVDLTSGGSTSPCNVYNFYISGYQNITYYNKLGVNIPSPYNISINGTLALSQGDPGPAVWNSYYDDQCNNVTSGAYITPTSVVITGTSTKVYVLGIGFL